MNIQKIQAFVITAIIACGCAIGVLQPSRAEAFGKFQAEFTTTCNGRQIHQIDPASLPDKLVRLEVEVKDGIETVIDAPAGLLESRQGQPSLRPIYMINAGRLLKEHIDAFKRSGAQQITPMDPSVKPVTPPDGRYGVLAAMFNPSWTPSKLAEWKTCNGNKPTFEVNPQIRKAYVYENCNSNCSMEGLIDKAFQPAQTQTVIIHGRHYFRMKDNGADKWMTGEHDDVLDASHITRAIEGDDGTYFHPEKFKIQATFRRMKSGLLDATDETNLLLDVSDIQACPDGKTQAICAPDETRVDVGDIRAEAYGINGYWMILAAAATMAGIGWYFYAKRR